ncbi:zinc-finger domain-containing protein [Roseicella sp. DB1501]|uniref:zinc-finger domain-containing protein n=1 Tax=Roseicella sp. DB1501 TaxID=2730925 RepID=UPI001492839F|nr:zinc-finger domain-containing protein [Roseicella sp. DB1501]NOG72132.1 zinc-finger domain-containing protein [Roseicella sp. DB1501]
MRDGKLTGYAPKPIPGITPEQQIEVESRAVPCDGDIGLAALGHPRVWLRMSPGEDHVTCPYCSITYVLKPGAGDDGHH